jgi:hypothetical protein
MSISVLLARGSNSEPAVTVYFSRKVFMITEKISLLSHLFFKLLLQFSPKDADSIFHRNAGIYQHVHAALQH